MLLTPLWRTTFIAVAVMLTSVLFRSVQAEEPAKWDVAGTVELQDVTVQLSTPRLIARSHSYLWFPTVIKVEGKRLLALMSNYADTHVTEATASASWSDDAGLTWSAVQQAHYGDIHARLKGGDILVLPYYLFPRDKDHASELVGSYELVRRGTKELAYSKTGVEVTGFPKPVGSFAHNLGLGGFVFNGQSVETKDGIHLATLYGYFADEKRYSLVAAESADGKAWKIRSLLAGADCKLKGNEGPCESALARLKDGRIVCVYRMDSGQPYGQQFSNDEGKTWTEPAAMDGPFSVQPALAVMEDGAVALSGGRPGVFCWLNLPGDMQKWQAIDLGAHHNATQKEQIDGRKPTTSAYTEVIALDKDNLLVIYDRVANGWAEIPKGSEETNSVWVVRLSLHRK